MPMKVIISITRLTWSQGTCRQVTNTGLPLLLSPPACGSAESGPEFTEVEVGGKKGKSTVFRWVEHWTVTEMETRQRKWSDSSINRGVPPWICLRSLRLNKDVSRGVKYQTQDYSRKPSKSFLCWRSVWWSMQLASHTESVFCWKSILPITMFSVPAVSSARRAPLR